MAAVLKISLFCPWRKGCKSESKSMNPLTVFDCSNLFRAQRVVARQEFAVKDGWEASEVIKESSSQWWEIYSSGSNESICAESLCVNITVMAAIDWFISLTLESEMDFSNGEIWIGVPLSYNAASLDWSDTRHNWQQQTSDWLSSFLKNSVSKPLNSICYLHSSQNASL